MPDCLVLLDSTLSRTDKTFYAVIRGIPILKPDYFTDQNEKEQFLTSASETSITEQRMLMTCQRKWIAYHEQTEFKVLLKVPQHCPHSAVLQMASDILHTPPASVTLLLKISSESKEGAHITQKDLFDLVFN